MKKSRIGILVSLLLACFQCKALAHAPVTLPFSLHHSNLLHQSNPFANVPVSGSSRAFYTSIKTLTGYTIKNTVINAPLNNISGQLNGVVYYKYSSGLGTPFYNYPYSVFMGSNPLNTGTSGLPTTLTNLSNTFTGGLPGTVSNIRIFPASIGGHAFSGAAQVLQGYYNGAATTGYNTGITMLQHPTGGLLFGTQYYTNNDVQYPGFYAFGNNPYASSAVAKASYGQLSLSQPLTSYLQFGKIVRPVTNGALFGTIYQPSVANPPYGAALPGAFITVKQVLFAIGPNPFNNLRYGIFTSNLLNSVTYFK